MSAQNENIVLDHMNLMFKEMVSIFSTWSDWCDAIENILCPSDENKTCSVDIQTDDNISTAASDNVEKCSVEV